MIQFRKILVPTDFSSASKQAIPYGCAMAKQHEAELVLCHVLEMPHYPTLFEGTAVVVPPLDESLRTQLAAQLDELAAETSRDHGVACRALIRDGSPTQELLDCATDEQADLIVIATHGYTGLKHMLLGSTAEQIVRHASCPVLTIRADLG